MVDTPQMVLRFERRTDEPDDTTYDILYVDRLTGKTVMRYDGADPANTNPAYGAVSDRDALKSRGYDIDEEIDIGRSIIRVDPREVDRLIRNKAAKAERDREEAEARDLLEYLGDEAKAFDFSKYNEGERDILTPALEKRGFTAIGFYTIEGDSFGPMIRGAAAYDANNKRVRFVYG